MDQRSCPPDLIVENVHVSDEILGVRCPARASYTSEISGGLRCVVKKFADFNSDDLFSTFIDRSKKWSQLRHPNIQQLLGVYVDNSGVPAVVTELVPFNLLSFLQLNLSQSIRYCLLLDVARGLQYLHTRNPPIAHGKVTASNILVTSGFQARLSDLTIGDCNASVSTDTQADIIAFGRIVHLTVCSYPVDCCLSGSSDSKGHQGYDEHRCYSANLHNLSLKCLCNEDANRLHIDAIVEEIKAVVNGSANSVTKNATFPDEELSSAKNSLIALESHISELDKTAKTQEEALSDHHQKHVLLEKELESMTSVIEAQKEQLEYYQKLLFAKDTEIHAQRQALNSKHGQLKIKEREIVYATHNLYSKESALALANTRIRALDHQLQTFRNKQLQPASPSFSMNIAAALTTDQCADEKGKSEEAHPVCAQITEEQEATSNLEKTSIIGGPDLLKRRGRGRLDRLATLSDGIILSDWMMVKGPQTTAPPDDTEPKLTSLLARQLKKIDENTLEDQVKGGQRETSAPPDDTEPKLTSLLARQLKKIDEITLEEQIGSSKRNIPSTSECSQSAVVMRRKKSVTQEADPQLQKLLDKRRSIAEDTAKTCE